MNEKNWQSELTAYIDGELPEAERKALEAALAADPKLQALEKKLRQTIALVKTLPAPEPSRALKQSVLAHLDEEKRPSWFSWPTLVPAMTLAAAAVLVLVLRGGREELPPLVVDEEVLVISQNMEVVEDLDLVGLASAEDLEVVEQLKDLEVTP